MPVLFPDGRTILSGASGDGRIKINGVTPPAIEKGLFAAGSWAVRTFDVVLGNGTEDGETWALWQYTISSDTLVQLDARGASNTYAGGDRWSVYLAANPPESYVSEGWTRTDLVARGRAPSGAGLYSTMANDQLFVQELNGTISAEAAGLVYSCMIGRGDVVLWCDTGGQLHSGTPNAIVAPFSGGFGAKFTRHSSGQAYICHWVDCVKQFAFYPWQATGPLSGFPLSGDQHDFNHDIGFDGRYITIATGYDSGESATRFYEVDPSGGTFRVNGGPWQQLTPVRLDVPPPVTIPGFKFNHDVTLAVFKDLGGISGSPAEVLVNQQDQIDAKPFFEAEDSLTGVRRGERLGIYSEAVYPASVIKVATQHNTRVLLGHDSLSYWTIPTALLRAWDIPTLEFYLHQTETVAQSAERWHRQLLDLLAQWTGDVGAIPMFYCGGGEPPNELFTVAQVLEGLSHLSDLVNTNKRIKVVAPFAYSRANGIIAHPELHAAWENLVAACPKMAKLTPVGTTPVPPIPPNPIPVPPNPIPEPPMTYPFKCFLINGHNSKIPAVEPGTHKLQLDYSAQECGPFQEVIIDKSQTEEGYVLAKFVQDGWLIRMDTVELQQRHYDKALQLYDPANSDADSGWQHLKIYGNLLIAEGPDDVNGMRGVAYAFEMIDSEKKPLFR